ADPVRDHSACGAGKGRARHRDASRLLAGPRDSVPYYGRRHYAVAGSDGPHQTLPPRHRGDVRRDPRRHRDRARHGILYAHRRLLLSVRQAAVTLRTPMLRSISFWLTAVLV